MTSPRLSGCPITRIIKQLELKQQVLTDLSLGRWYQQQPLLNDHKPDRQCLKLTTATCRQFRHPAGPLRFKF